MISNPDLEIFLAAVPGLEGALLLEAQSHGFQHAEAVAGGVTFRGDWPDVWRANLGLRGASRVLVRLGAFRALHLAQLDKRARKFPWGETLTPDVPVRVEVTTRKSRIYHKGAAAERISRAITEELGAPVTEDADLIIKARIFDDMCTLSVDTSGEGLHKRGFKQAVNRAPLRETLAALILRECGFSGNEPVLDPMCGSGTFVIEAAEIAAGLMPGRARAFAFEHLATFDDAAWQKMRLPTEATEATEANDPGVRFYGFDRDGGAAAMSRANAERAGVAAFTEFEKQAISDLSPPTTAPGLVVINPPYGTRIGEVKKLTPLYEALGRVLRERFRGWRVGLATNSAPLAKATGMRFGKNPLTFSHGGIKVTLYKTEPLT